MPKLQKKSPLLGLSKYQTYLIDTNPNSEYFKLSEVPDSLTAGKNAFLIEGTPYLKPTTEVKIEVLDVNGNPLYVEPGDGVPEYYEGLSKLISIHVYSTTPIGIGKITILGEAQTYLDENGVERYVPGEWDGVYNVKWEKEIKINKNVPNETRVRFYKRPVVIVEETGESFYSKVVTSSIQTTGTVRGLAITPPIGTDLNTWRGGIKYLIQNESADFVDNAKSITIPGTPIQNVPVLEYLNQRSVIIQTPNSSSAGILQIFTSSNYTLEYETITSIQESSLFGSFARFEINNLATFVGDVERLKVYAKSRASSADYYLLHDTKIDSSNLLTIVVSGSTENLGYFTASYSNGNPYTYYWTTQSAANVSLDTKEIYKAIKFQNNKISTNLGDNIRLEKGSEYTVEFYVYYSGSAVRPSDELTVYISSTIQTSPLTTNYILTESIAKIYGGNLYKNGQKLSYNFIPSITDNWTLNFEATNPNSDTYWHIGSVVLEGSNELGYSPDEYTFTIPISRQLEQETFDFRFDYYDINNNFVPITDTATQTFVSGNITLLGKNLAVDADKYFFTFEENSLAKPVQQTISINANKTRLNGNLIITSQAFDSGGIYLPPASFLGEPYPGKLSGIYEDANLFTASLDVTQFTGSLHGVPPSEGNVIVDRMLYTFTEPNSTQPQIRRLSVSRVLTNAGTGSQGAAGNDAKVVSLTSNVYAIPYGNDGTEIGVNNVYLTASQQHHIGVVWYEFLKNEVTKQNTTSEYYYVSQSEKPNTGSRDSWRVNTREGSGVGTIVAFDTIDIFGLKDGAGGYTVFFTNGATAFPANEFGVVSSTDLLVGVTDTIFIRGTSSFTYDQDSPYGTNTYRTGSITASANISYSSSIVNNNLRLTPTAISTNGGVELTGSIIVPLIDNYTAIPFNISYTYSVSKAGPSGSNAVSIVLTPPTQTIRYRPDSNLFTTASKFIVTVLETGSALYYTSSISNLDTSSFTILLDAGNGTNNSTDNIKSGSITPIQPTNTLGTTSSFAIVYKDSKGRVSQAVSASHIVSVVSDGLSGSNAVNIIYSPVNQVVSKSNAGNYGTPTTFSIQVFETGSALIYTGSDATLQNSYFTIWMPSNNGIVVPATGSLSASIIPPNVTSDEGATASFAIQYRDSIGRLSQYVSQSYRVYVVADGLNGTSGSDAKVVSLTSDRYNFTYDQNGTLSPLNDQTASLTASSQNVNVAYYEFIKNGISKQNTTSQYYIITGSEIPTAGNRDLWQVNLRSGSVGSTILAFDNLDIFGLRSGSDSYTVFLTNESHIFPADDLGNVATANLEVGATDVRFYRGTLQFTYNQSGGINTYKTGSIISSSNITISESIVNNDVRITPTYVDGVAQLTGSVIIPIVDNTTNVTFTKTYTFAISKAGSSGSNAVDIVLDSTNQNVVYKTNQGTVTSVVPFFVRVKETGSFLTYTTSNPPTQNSTFTVVLSSVGNNGTNNSLAGETSASITPPNPNSTTPTTSSFTVIYKDSKGSVSKYISSSHYVAIVTDGTSGSNAVNILLNPTNQTVSKSLAGTYQPPVTFSIFVYETGSALRYTGSNNTLQAGYFTIFAPTLAGVITNATGSLSASIAPPLVTQDSGLTSSFAIQYRDSKGTLSQYITASHFINVVKDGASGSNAVSVFVNPSNQNVTKSLAGTYSSATTFSIFVYETGSALRYTGSTATLQNSYFTIWLPTGAGTLVPATGSLSASIIPPAVVSDSGITSSFAIQYRDSKGTLSQFVTASHFISVTKDGGTGSNALTILLSPTNQTVSRSLVGGGYSAPTTFSIYVYETGSALRYTGSNNTLQPGYFTIFAPTLAGKVTNATGSLSASIAPPLVTTDAGYTSSFAVQYRDSKGNLSSYLSQSHVVSVLFNGQTGPGIVVTGPWTNGYLYQYDVTGSTGRRDVVYETSSKYYYGTLQQHTAAGSNKPTGTTSDNAYWQFLGSSSLFVAAKIGIFEDSYVQKVLNIGTNNNGGVSSANITLMGSGSFPYISIGQSSDTGSQGYGVGSGIFIGRDDADGAYKASFETASGEFLKWDGANLLISGNISASKGNIGGWSISKTAITSPNLSMSFDAVSESIIMISQSLDGGITKTYNSVEIAPGPLKLFGTVTKAPVIVEFSGLGSGTTYSTVATFYQTGSAASRSFSVSSGQTGSYDAVYGPVSTVVGALTPVGFQGIAILELILQIGSGSMSGSFTGGNAYTTTLGTATISNPAGPTTSTAVDLTPNASATSIYVFLDNVTTYWVRLAYRLTISNRTFGNVYITNTTTITPTPLTLYYRDYSFTEIADGGLQVVYSNSRYVKIPRTATGDIMTVGGNITTTGTITAGTKPFKITHPLDENKWLMHLAIESPNADLIYRGVVNLVSGSASVNMDIISRMTTGTWELLNRNGQFFLQNMNGWDRVKGELSGSNLTIISENSSSNDLISYMVIGERKDKFMYQTNITDGEGRLITEFNK